MKPRLPVFLFSLSLLATATLAHGGEVYQWFDSMGGIHFTDDYYATPVALRDTPNLIVRTDLGKEQAVDSNSGASPITRRNVDREDRWANNAENYEANSRYVDANSESFEPPQNVIVVVNDSLPTKPCRHSCAGRFKPDFNDRQYIHPSVFNSSPHHSVRSRLFRSRQR
jgi:hypothetical protein